MTQDPAAPVPPSQRIPASDDFATGPSIGERFPDFTLQNQHNQPVNLETARAGRRALIVFQRSARWWPYCRTQLVELQRSVPEFEAAHVWVAAISYDPAGAIAQFCDEQGITYEFLGDEGSMLIRQLGILNTLVQPDEAVHGIPYPGSYLLDERGVVAAKFFHREYQLREAASVLLADGFGLRPDLDSYPEATLAEPDVRVTAQLGAPDLKFKQVVDLRIGITLGTTLHVNGPEAEDGLIPLAVQVTSPADVQISEPRYPETKPLRVDGFSRPLQVLEGELDVPVRLVSNEREAETVPVDIEVEYQACSEEECFLPRTVRLHLDLPVGRLNRAPRPGS